MFDPEADQTSYVTIEEVQPGVWFVIDQDGDAATELCDAGPWSVSRDAVNALNDAENELNERLAENQVLRYVEELEAREWEVNA